MQLHLYTSIIISLLVRYTEQETCGILNQYQLFNEDSVAALNEFPWLGQIYYFNTLFEEYKMLCISVLINKRYLLALAHCFVEVRENDPEFVILGDSNTGNDINEHDCNDNGECAPKPKKYMIENVAIHPKYDRWNRLYDIAIIRLTDDVEFSDYIQPICLPPVSVHNNDFLAQYYHYAGFLNNRFLAQQSNKTKTLAHIIPSERCQVMLNMNISLTYLCTSVVGNYMFLSGSALMGVNIVNSKLSNFYLLGLTAFGTTNPAVPYDVFTKISSYINWIQNNCDISKSISTSIKVTQ